MGKEVQKIFAGRRGKASAVRRWAAWIFSVFLVLAAVLPWYPAAAKNVEAAGSIALVEKSGSISIGGSTAVKLKKRPAGATVSYSSGKKSVATVSKAGKILGVAPGTAKITVKVGTSGGVKKLVYTITVKKPVISRTSETLSVGEVRTLAVRYKPKKATYQWSSSDTSVATVAGGKVTPRAAGSAVIKVQVRTGKKTYPLTCKLTVRGKENGAAASGGTGEKAEEGTSGKLKTCTVSFDTAGGTAIPSVSVVYGKTVEKPADPVRTGYAFDGWFADQACTKTYDWGQIVTGDLTLYAKWKANATVSSGGIGGGYSGGSTGGSSGGSSSGGASGGSSTGGTSGGGASGSGTSGGGASGGGASGGASPGWVIAGGGASGSGSGGSAGGAGADTGNGGGTGGNPGTDAGNGDGDSTGKETGDAGNGGASGTDNENQEPAVDPVNPEVITNQNSVVFKTQHYDLASVDKDQEFTETDFTWSQGAEQKNRNLIWDVQGSTAEELGAIRYVDGKFVFHPITPGTFTVSARYKESGADAAEATVSVANAGITKKEVTSGAALLDYLNGLTEEQGRVILTLKTNEAAVDIRQANAALAGSAYGNVTLVVDAPKTTVTNALDFKEIFVKSVAKDTWIEQRGNSLFFDEGARHLLVDRDANPSLSILGGSDSVTVENNGHLKEILIAQAAKVLIKGDAIAQRVHITNIGGRKTDITTFLPADIESTTTFSLVIGEGGEETAVEVPDEGSKPEISGLGTITIHIGEKGRDDEVGKNDGKLEQVLEENPDLLEKATKSFVYGVVMDAQGDHVNSGTVYLVPYTLEMEQQGADKVSLSGFTKTQIASDGTYRFSDVLLGNYVLIVESGDYPLHTQNIYLNSAYDENRGVQANFMLFDETGNPGSISGTVVDSTTGGKPTQTLKVILRKGMNNITKDEAGTTTTDADGKFRFENLAPGQYTVQIRDMNETAVYLSAYENIAVLTGADAKKTIYVSPEMDNGELRFVLTWGNAAMQAAKDLDLHVFGPDAFQGTEFHLCFSGSGNSNRNGNLLATGNSVVFAELDVDDKEYEGPETVTVKNRAPGRYKVFVQNYSNEGTDAKHLYRSSPQLKVYSGAALVDTITMSEQAGKVWYAGDYDSELRKFYVVDEASNADPGTSMKAQVGTVLNRLTQFTIYNSQDQAAIQEIKLAYIRETDTEVLEGYKTRLQTLEKKYKTAMTLVKLTYSNTQLTKGSYAANHEFRYGTYYHYIQGKTEKLENFAAECKEADATKWELENLAEQDGDYDFAYRLTLKNEDVGVSTCYYFNYRKEVTGWVKEITESGNTDWKCEVYKTEAYAGGEKADLGPEQVDVTYYNGVEEVSREYRCEKTGEDLEAWTRKYGDAEKPYKVGLVLHLKNGEATCDYRVYYVPWPAKLYGLVGKANQFTRVSIDDNRQAGYLSGTGTIILEGMESSLGTLEAVVDNGVQCVFQDSSDSSIAKELKMTNPQNGAVYTYRIRYEQDTSDAAIIGLRDPGNVLTGSEAFSNYIEGTSVTRSISLQGKNSELGKNLVVSVPEGATKTIEYATSSVSFNNSSVAKITVTGKSGSQRVYYIGYAKTSDTVHLQDVASAQGANTFYSVHVSGSTVTIRGKNKEMGDLAVTAENGFTAAYDSSTRQIQVTDQLDPTQKKTYSVRYVQDTSCVRLLAVSNAAKTLYYISSHEIGGKAQSCPQDLVAVVSPGATASISYRQDGSGAEITVTKGDVSAQYVVHYISDSH